MPAAKHADTAFVFFRWRRRELNPGPKIWRRQLLPSQLVIRRSLPARQANTTCVQVASWIFSRRKA